MNKVRATLAAAGVAIGVLAALPTSAGAQEIVPKDVLLQWRSYGAFAHKAQQDVVQRMFAASPAAAPVQTEVNTPFKLEKDIQIQETQSPGGFLVSAVEQAIGLD